MKTKKIRKYKIGGRNERKRTGENKNDEKQKRWILKEEKGIEGWHHVEKSTAQCQ